MSKRRSKFKRCFYCTHDVPIDYKDTERLKNYITPRGKILPRRITGVCAKHQRALTKAIMRARVMALLAYVKKY
jgi:small subunit ribosomal protein S18